MLSQGRCQGKGVRMGATAQVTGHHRGRNVKELCRESVSCMYVTVHVSFEIYRPGAF